MTEPAMTGISPARPGPLDLAIRAYSWMRKNVIPVGTLVLVIALVYVLSKYNFALFHTAIEFFTIAVAVAIFLLVWKSRHIVQNNYLLFIGVAFVFIAVLDFLHTTMYQGVGIFPDGGGPLSTRLWIAARYMEAITLLAAPLLIRRNLRIDLVAIVYLAADIVIVASIFIFRNFPATYIEGVGLTPFKIISEYIVCILLIGAVVLLYRNRESFDRQVLDNLVIAIVLTIISELSFAEYASFVDIFSVIGHVVRLVAYYFFYRAIIEVGQEKPYNLLYRDINESEKKYRALFNSMTEGFALHEIVCDAQGNPVDYRFLEINPAFEHLTGLPREKIVGKCVSDVLPGLGKEWIDSYGNVARTGVPVMFDNYAAPLDRYYGVYAYSPSPRQCAVLFSDITERKRADDERKRKHEELNAAYEELTSAKRALQQKVDELGRSEKQLRQNEAELKEALEEKEVLLSEIHHRVKNNLTAFISLLSLEGSYDDTPAGVALKKDLQNRARSMALIHETLYRTNRYSSVDMGVYLKTLVDQIAGSYTSPNPVELKVDTGGVVLDLSRATTCGLIINEIITNSFKYAFPASFSCPAVRNEPCTIAVSLRNETDTYVMSVRDNGIGLPEGFDTRNAKSLGLKLVNFLAKYQLRAVPEITSGKGTEFIIRFPKDPKNSPETS